MRALRRSGDGLTLYDEAAMAVSDFIFGKQQQRAMEVLDLRHFSAAQMKPLLASEAVQWRQRLAWDYSKSIELLLEYVNGRVLPGFVATQNGSVTGYTFGVLEEAKAVIGDAFAFGETEGMRNPVCESVLAHLIETLQATPGVDRIEAQLLLFPVGALRALFTANRFRSYPRLFMMCDVTAMIERGSRPAMPRGLRLQAWRPEFYDPAAELIHRCYAGHMDSGINDQYQSVAGSQRFLHNIIRFPGCGTFEEDNSWLLLDEHTGRPQALLLSSMVETGVAHVTQVCVAPSLRGAGLGRLLLLQAADVLRRRGGRAMSLTVTEANTPARRVYEELGFAVAHRFEALVWVKGA